MTTFWYLTRGSGAAALVLLTASICLGILTTLRWHARSLPRFAVAGLHRSLTLVAVVFVALHVATTVLDGYAPVGWKDALVPFVSHYRPIWLGLGAVAFDLLLALVATSLLRARIGFRTWRLVHWLAYASWPVALVHALGTGSDARAGWLRLLALACTGAVLAALATRLVRRPSGALTRIGAGAAAAAVALAVAAWYATGPAERGWAARAGTPPSLLAAAAAPARVPQAARFVSLPSSFRARFAGLLSQTQSGDAVDIRIDGRLSAGLRGRLRLVLEGVPLDEGGVSMTASGVAFAPTGSRVVYEGSVVGLDGRRIAADVSGGGRTIRLQIELQLQSGTHAVGGVVDGSAA